MHASPKRIPAFCIFFPVSILYMELVLKFFCFHTITASGFLFTLLFTIAAGLFCAALVGLLPQKAGHIVGAIIVWLIFLLFGVQAVYYKIFRTFTTIYSATTGVGRITDFWREGLSGIVHTLPILLLLVIPAVLWHLLFKHSLDRRKDPGLFVVIAVVAAAVQLITIGLIYLTGDDVNSPKDIYKNEFLPDASVSEFGLLTTFRLDARNLIFPRSIDDSIDDFEPTGNDPLDQDEQLPEGDEPSEDDPSATEEQPKVYGDNVLPIDFDALIASETDETLLSMHKYFSSQTPTKENEYTGLFKGKNLIWICAEGFSSLAVDPVLTPTLYKLSHECFVFNNFYNPIWSVSTSDGEYVMCTGLIPKSGVWSFYQSGKIRMPFAFGNMFKRIGYPVRAYHDHTFDYYNRDVSHPNMGYIYKAIGNGLEMENKWPRSDLEMMEKTIPEYINDKPFHTYYMTVSGHLNYNFTGNSMAYKHRDEVADLPYSEAPRAYIACNMELDHALAYLLDQLEQAGQLENTVIAMNGDHYPYGLTEDEMSEILGHQVETEFEMYKSTLVLWSGDMANDEPIQIDKPCCSMDVMPTLANLFDLDYDSRLCMGRDILSEYPGLVIFKNRSWISDLGRYNATKKEFTPNEGAEIPEDYQKDISTQVKNKFNFSASILDTDYYGIITDSLGWNE